MVKKTNAYIRIKDSNGNIVWPNVNNIAGFKIEEGNIKHWDNAVRGPKQLGDIGGYDAMIFDPKGLTKGDYYIEFSKSQSAPSKDEIFTEFWDITVVDTRGSLIT